MKTFNLLTMCATLAVAGCGETDTGGRVAVSGNITYRGKPLAKGQINFTPANGNSGVAAGVAIKDGRFQIRAEQGPTVGEYKVTVTTGVLPPKDFQQGALIHSQEQQIFEFTRSIEGDRENLLDFDLSPKDSL